MKIASGRALAMTGLTKKEEGGIEKGWRPAASLFLSPPLPTNVMMKGHCEGSARSNLVCDDNNFPFKTPHSTTH